MCVTYHRHMTKKTSAPNHNDPYALYTREEAAAFLRVNLSTITEITKSGQLYSVRLGRRLLIPRRALEAFVRDEPAGIDAPLFTDGTPSMFNRDGTAAVGDD